MILFNSIKPLNYFNRVFRNIIPILILALVAFFEFFHSYDWTINFHSIFLPILLITVATINSAYRNRYYITHIEIEESNITIVYYKFNNFYEINTEITHLHSDIKPVNAKPFPPQWKLILISDNIKIVQYPSNYFDKSEWDAETIEEINNKINEIKRSLKTY